MYEAHPYVESPPPTIATELGSAFETFLITGNEWVFQGLDTDFDDTVDLGRQYLISHDALDPAKYFTINKTRLTAFLKDAVSDDVLFDSLRNLLAYRTHSGYGIQSRDAGDAEEYQSATVQADHIRRWLQHRTHGFVFANFMDVHAPISVSDAALARFGDGDDEQLPVGQPSERHLPDDQKSYDVEMMERLYHAAVWDVDRKLTPLIEELVADDALVILTADHGRVDTKSAYSDQRLHVPLVVFDPDSPATTVEHTVSIRSIGTTILQHFGVDSSRFEGKSLLNVAEDQTCITEVIHHPNEVFEETQRVDITRLTDKPDAEIQHDVVVRCGDVLAKQIGREFSCHPPGSAECDRLRELVNELRSHTVSGTRPGGIDYDPVTLRRLEELGYL
jgi:membrane-anchored protein YejM (alkaline phosphatase superfamily)